MQPMFLCVFIACNAQTWSCSSSLIRTEVTIHHSACAPVLSGRTRVIHHSHGNCLFSGQLCNQRPIRPSARLSLLLSLSANCHSLIRLSQTIRHQCQEEKKEVVFLFFFIHFFFILYSLCPQQGFSGLLLSFFHWRGGEKWARTICQYRAGSLTCNSGRHTKACLLYLTTNRRDFKFDISLEENYNKARK